MTENKTPYVAHYHDDVLTFREKRAKMKIRNGLRLILLGIEQLWQLPRSFTTKREDENGKT